MGESLGSLYTYIVYMIAIICIALLIFMVIDVYFFFGGIYAIQDGLKNDPGVNRDTYYRNLFREQAGEFKPCSGNATASSSCSGVISVNDTNGVIKYRIIFDGRFLELGPKTAEEYISF